MPVAGEVNLMTQFCFVMEIRGSARLILGSKDEPRGIEEKGKR